MKRALIYCRVSTQRQEDEGASLDTQEAACRRFCDERGWQIARVTREVYTGAELWDRPKLAQDRADLRTGRFDAIVCYAIDRLSRDPVHLGILQHEIERAGAELHFVSERLEDSLEGEIVLMAKGIAAKVERVKIRERASRGKRGRMERGLVHRFGPELYGYRRDRERGVRVIYEPEAAIVRRIFAEKAAGVGYYQLAKILNREKIPTPGQSKNFTRANSSGHWGPTTIAGMIGNPAYKGAPIAWKRKANGKGKAVNTDPSEWIALPPETTPAIVSAELWQQANDSARTNRGDRKRNMDRPILLRGLIVCAGCGYRLYWDSYGNYRCRKAGDIAGKPALCPGRPVNAAEIEASVWAEIRALLEQPELLLAAIIEAQASGATANDLESRLDLARRQLVDVERQQRKLLDEMLAADGEAWRTVFEAKKHELARQRQSAADQIATLERQIEQIDHMEAQASRVLDMCATYRASLDEYGFAEKRQVLETLGVRVVASGQDAELHLSIGEVSEILRYLG